MRAWISIRRWRSSVRRSFFLRNSVELCNRGTQVVRRKDSRLRILRFSDQTLGCRGFAAVRVIVLFRQVISASGARSPKIDKGMPFSCPCSARERHRCLPRRWRGPETPKSDQAAKTNELEPPSRAPFACLTKPRDQQTSSNYFRLVPSDAATDLQGPT